MSMDIVKRTRKKIEKSSKKLAKKIALKSHRRLIINFLILTVNLLVIILYFSLSQARVIITAAKETISRSITLPVLAKDATANAFGIAGDILIVAVADFSQSFPVTESTNTVGAARGELKVINTLNRSQILVKDTRFGNDAGLVLRSDKTITLGPGETVNVTGYATVEGKDGEANEGKFQIVALPALKDKIYAEISKPFTGGAGAVPTVTAAWFEKSKQALVQSLEDQAWAAMQKEHPADATNRAHFSFALTGFFASANPGDLRVESVTMTGAGAGKLFIFDSTHARDKIKENLLTSIPANKTLVNFDEGSLTLTPNADNQTVVATIQASIEQKIPQELLTQDAIVGMNRAEVKEYFERITGVRSVDVRLWPFWVRTVPDLKDHVDIEVQH